MKRKITDKQNELFNVVNKNDKVIGQATRKECHRNPALIHRVVFLLIFNNKNQVLLQKRSPTKDLYANYWTGSVSGHVPIGKSYKETLLLETQEELGIRLKNFKFVDKFLVSTPQETEYVSFFKTKHQGPFKFNKKEIAQIKWFNLNKLKTLIKNKKIKLTLCAKVVFNYFFPHF